MSNLGYGHEEKWIEDYLFAHPEIFGDDVRWLARQLGLSSGQLDLLGVANDSGVWLLVEVKVAKKALLNGGILQLLRYQNDVDEIMDFVFRGKAKPELAKILVNGDYFENDTIRNAEAVGVDLYELQEKNGDVVLRHPTMCGSYNVGTCHAADRVKEAFEEHKAYYWGWDDGERLAANLRREGC
jgi:hypothetical protein